MLNAFLGKDHFIKLQLYFTWLICGNKLIDLEFDNLNIWKHTTVTKISYLLRNLSKE